MPITINFDGFVTKTSIAGTDSIVGFTSPVAGGEFKITLNNLVTSIINADTWDSNIFPDIDASKITSGIIDSARIGSINASSIDSGTINGDRLPTIPVDKLPVIPVEKLPVLTPDILGNSLTNYVKKTDAGATQTITCASVVMNSALSVSETFSTTNTLFTKSTVQSATQNLLHYNTVFKNPTENTTMELGVYLNKGASSHIMLNAPIKMGAYPIVYGGTVNRGTNQYNAEGVRYISTSAPTGGNDGDIWITV